MNYTKKRAAKFWGRCLGHSRYKININLFALSNVIDTAIGCSHWYRTSNLTRHITVTSRVSQGNGFGKLWKSFARGHLPTSNLESQSQFRNYYFSCSFEQLMFLNTKKMIVMMHNQWDYKLVRSNLTVKKSFDLKSSILAAPRAKPSVVCE